MEVASCIFAQRMQRRTRTEATGWRTSMEWAEPGSEEVEDEEEDEAEPWRGLGRALEGMLGGIVGRMLMVLVCVVLVRVADQDGSWALGLVGGGCGVARSWAASIAARTGQGRLYVYSSCCGVSSRGMERRDQKRL